MSTEPSKKRGLFGRLFGKSEPQPQAPAPDAGPPAEERADAERTGADLAELEVAVAAEPEAAATVADEHQDEPAPAVEAEAAPEEAGALIEAETVATPEVALSAEVDEPASPSPAPAKNKGWLGRLTEGLSKTSSKLTEGISGLFTKKKLDVETLDDLEDVLLQADLGVETATRITDALRSTRYQKGISAEDVRHVLAGEVERVLAPVAKPLAIDKGLKPHVVLVVGVNGTGKTTTIGKLAAKLKAEGKSVMMAAGDTFRAAAIDQLKVWGERTDTPVIARNVGADSSGLAFDALKAAADGGYDVLLLDTAGRLQNKQALMEELEKVLRVLRKIDSTAPHDVLLVLDATTGQNALSQVEVFRERAGVTGLIMTKLDGTARGGILVAISAKFGLPVHAIGVGEGIDDLQPFDAGEFARAIAVS